MPAVSAETGAGNGQDQGNAAQTLPVSYPNVTIAQGEDEIVASSNIPLDNIPNFYFSASVQGSEGGSGVTASPGEKAGNAHVFVAEDATPGEWTVTVSSATSPLGQITVTVPEPVTTEEEQPLEEEQDVVEPNYDDVSLPQSEEAVVSPILEEGAEFDFTGAELSISKPSPEATGFEATIDPETGDVTVNAGADATPGGWTITVTNAEGEEIDSFTVTVELPENFPVTYETGELAQRDSQTFDPSNPDYNFNHAEATVTEPTEEATGVAAELDPETGVVTVTADEDATPGEWTIAVGNATTDISEFTVTVTEARPTGIPSELLGALIAAGLVLPWAIYIGGAAHYLMNDGETYNPDPERANEAPTQEEKEDSYELLDENQNEVLDQSVPADSPEAGPRGVGANTGISDATLILGGLGLLALIAAGAVVARRKFFA